VDPPEADLHVCETADPLVLGAGTPLRAPSYPVSYTHLDVYKRQGHEVAFSGEFVRKTTVIRLRGSGKEGLGEDVTYAAEDQEALQRAGASAPLAGSWTLASFAEHLRSLDLFPQPTDRPEFRLYRNWAFDSAALDLALRQAGTTLHAALGLSLIHISSRTCAS